MVVISGVCANDGFGNGLWSDVWKFTIDTKPPISEIVFPINNKYYNNMDTIYGLASDIFNGTGVKGVEISIKRLNDNFYWDGSDWVEVEFWLQVKGTNSWLYDSNSVQWITDTFYNIHSRAIDNVSNQEIPGPGIIFMYDDQPPDISIIINGNATFTNSMDVILSLKAIVRQSP